MVGMRVGFRRKLFGPWLLVALIMGLAAAIRWRINFSGALMPGVNGPYYPVQVRSFLETGHLGFPDFPFAFWLEALVARLLFALKVGSLSDCIMLASKSVDALFPTLAAVPAYLLARAWIVNGTRRSWLALVVATFSVLFPFPLFMIADLQKNAVGAVWLFFYLYYLYQALRQGSWRSFMIAGVFFVLAALTHIGCFGIAIVFLLAVAAASLILEPARRRIILRGTLFLFLLLAAATAVLYLFFDPARVERLLGVFLLPAELFEKPVIFAGSSDPLYLLVVFIYALAIGGIILLIRRWKVMEPARRLIAAAAILTTLLLASPFFGQEWATRLTMTAYIPIAVVLAFLFAHLKSRTAITAVIAVALIPMVLFLTVVIPKGIRPAGISEASYKELQQLRSVIAQPEETLVLARHGLEWWAAWVLETDVGQEHAFKPSTWDQYDEILYLEQIAGSTGFGPGGGGPFGPPFPEVKIPPDAEILFEGQYFRLARATQPLKEW